MVDLTPAQRAALEWLPGDGVLISEIPGKHFDAIAFLSAAGLTKGESVYDELHDGGRVFLSPSGERVKRSLPT